MKKSFLIPALALILILSLSVGCFAAVYIDYTFTADVDGEEYTVVMGRADTADEYDEIGVTVNEIEYKIEDSKFSHAKETGRFGIAFKGERAELASATPYIKNNGEKIEGEEFAIDKTATLPEAITKEITPTIEYLDTDDRAKSLVTSSGLTTERIWADAIFGYNWINFLKIDVSAIKDTVDLTKNITLSLWGAMQPTRGNLAFMTIRTFMVPDSFNWETEVARRVDDSGYNFSKEDLESNGVDYDTYVTGKTAISTVVKELNEKKYGEFEINITPAVYQAVKNNENYAYVILAPDCAYVNEANNAVFRYYIDGNEKIPAPKIKYSEVDSTPLNAEISEVTIGTKKLTKADFVDGAYNYLLRAGEAYPEITVTPEVEGAQVNVTQASAETGYATVSVVSKNGKNTKTYTINYAEPKTAQFFSAGLVVNGFSNKAVKNETNPLEDFYYYHLNLTDNQRKNAGTGVVVNTSEEETTVTSSKYPIYNGPVLLQLDLSKLTNIDTSKPVKMNLYYTRDDAGKNNNVQLYDVTSAGITDWATLTTEYLKDTLYPAYIAGKTPVATEEAFIEGGYTDNVYAENGDVTSGCNVIDITSFVKQCIADKNMTPVVAVYLDGEGFFRFSYNTTTSSFISYFEDESYLSNTEIASFTIGDTAFTKEDLTDGAYTYYIKAGEEYPLVTATPEIEGATVTVTQASEDTNYAIINVVSYNGKHSATYKINFAEFNYTETITPTISYLGSNSSCSQKSGDDYRFISSIYNNSSTVNFLKIDISSLKNKDYINAQSRFTLNIRAKMQMGLVDTTGTGLDEMTVKAVALSDFDWDAEAADRETNTYAGELEGSDYYNYFVGKTPVATAKLPFYVEPDVNDYTIISLDISSVIYDAIQGEGNYAYIALAGDPDELDVNENVKNVNFYYNATANSYRTAPSITLDAYKIEE